MLKITLIANSLLVFLFWIAGVTAITPAYNHFVRYPEVEVVLSQLTEMAISLRLLVGVVPLTVSVISVFLYNHLKTKTPDYRNEFLLSLVPVTLCAGMFIFVFFF